MKKLKSLGLGLLFSVLGVGAGLGYNFITGDISAGQFLSEIKNFAGSIFVAVGGTGGLLLLFSQRINAKIQEFKSTINNMAANNEITTDTATEIKDFVDELHGDTSKIIDTYQEKLDEIIEESDLLRTTNAELTEEIKDLLGTLSDIANGVGEDE